jgi:anti-sigma factor RsiW
MTVNRSPGNAASDAELIRYLDGELNADERARVDAAVAGDVALADRLARLRARDERLRALLADADPSEADTRAANPATRTAGEPRASAQQGRTVQSDATVRPIEGARAMRTRRLASSRAPGGHWLRAAAVILALLGASLFVPPVRAWIVDRLESLVPGEDTAVEMSPAIPSADETSPVAYRMAVTGSTLFLDADAAQAGGELTVRVADVVNASLEPLDADAGDPVLVMPDEDRVRIQNGEGSTASYRLTLPRQVVTLRIRIGGGLVRTFELDAAGAEVRIPLSDTGA